MMPQDSLRSGDRQFLPAESFSLVYKRSGCLRKSSRNITPLNAELNPICHLVALLGAHHILHVSRIRVDCGREEF